MNNFSYRIRAFLEDLISIKWLCIGVILYSYGFFLRKNLFLVASADRRQINQWDFIIDFLGDAYLILYFILPIFLLISLSVTNIRFGDIWLIRLGSYSKWIRKSLLYFSTKAFYFLIINSLVISLLIIGVPKDGGWSEFTLSHSGLLSESPANIIAKYLDSPMLAILLQIFQMLLFFIIVHLVQTIILVASQRFVFSIASVVLLWLFCGISFKWGVPDSIFQLTNYMSFFHGLRANGNLTTLISVVTAFLSLFILLFLRHELRLFISKLKLKYIIYFFLTMLALLFVFQRNLVVSVKDVFVLLFYGSSQTGWSFLSFMSYVIIYYGFTYFALIVSHNEIYNLSFLKILRFGSINRWFWVYIRRILLSIILFLILWSVFVIIIARISGLQFSDSFFSNISYFELFYHFIANGFLQLMFYILLAFIISWKYKEVFYGFVVMMGLLFFMLPGINNTYLIPSGLNSVGYLVDGVSPFQITITLLLFILIEVVVVYYYITRLDFQPAK